MVIWGLTAGAAAVHRPDRVRLGLIGSFYVSNFFALVVNLSLHPAVHLDAADAVHRAGTDDLRTVGGRRLCRDPGHARRLADAVFGFAAFFLRKLDYPLAPAVLAIVLGPIAEPTLRQSLLLSSGDPSIFFTRPIAGPITVIAIILIFLPLFKMIWTKIKPPKVKTPV